ncbi:MAG: hypothetical protein ACJAS1_001023 [Oleiphilaceae bacterium]|jgi:uncharacterized protein YebE (UPF0316 family)
MAVLLVKYIYLLALLIFFVRVPDVSLETLRTIVIFRGHKLLANKPALIN